MKTKMSCLAIIAVLLGVFGPSEEPAAAQETMQPTQAEQQTAEAPQETPQSEPETEAETVWAAETAPTPEAAPEETMEPAAEPTPEPDDGPEICATTILSDEIKNYTSHAVDASELLARGSTLALPAEGPQILIIHTHSSEAYTAESGEEYEESGDWRTTDETHSVIAVGAALAEALEEYGLRVVHDTTLYDWPSYNSAYVNAAAAIEDWLEQYPDIAMVIDLHRDAIGDEERIYKTLADTDEPTAQLMFVVGSDQNLPHPNWQENLALALQLQQAVQQQCPTLMRPVVLSSCRYNQQYTTGSLILEVGTCGNTLSEALAAVEQFAGAVGPLLAERVQTA